MKTIANKIIGFIKAHKLLFAIIVIAIMFQFLLGITAWKICAVALTLILIGWVGSQHRTVGKILFWIFAGLWIYHMATTEFSKQLPMTDMMKVHAQNEKDVDMAEEIAPELVGTRQVLIQKKLDMQNDYAKKIAEANSKDEIEKLNNSQFEETRWYDKEIKRVDDLIKERKNIKNPPNPEPTKVNVEVYPPMLDETVVGKVGNKGTAHFFAEMPFEIKERTEDGFVAIYMPAGKSSRYFEWGGNIRVIGKGRDDVKLVKVTY